VLGLAADSFVILTAGRLEALKGQRTVVEACALGGDLGNTRWVVAGEGPDQAFLERLARSLGVAERVIFAGPLPDLPGRMPDSQVFVLASFQEGLGSALLDSLAAGVPAIVAEGSGAAEVVTDGVEGFLLTLRAASRWARRRACERSPSRSARRSSERWLRIGPPWTLRRPPRGRMRERRAASAAAEAEHRRGPGRISPEAVPASPGPERPWSSS
jgi:glycosyltransferase involved in cell wall biosynthesis